MRLQITAREAESCRKLKVLPFTTIYVQSPVSVTQYHVYSKLTKHLSARKSSQIQHNNIFIPLNETLPSRLAG